MAIAVLALVSCKPEAIPPTAEAYPPPQYDIQEEAALLHGSIVSQGSSYVTSRVFEWGTDSSLLKYKTVEAGDGDGSFTAWLWGLTPATRYYYRVKATNDAGTSVSEIVSFTTGGRKSSAPTVSWKYEPYDITGEGATLCAEITSDGDSKVTQCGFCWSTGASTPVLSSNNFIADGASGLGTFELKAKGLKLTTTYNVRAWAKNAIGIGYSSEVKTFTTEGLKTIDATGAEFDAASPSSSVRYRLTGGIINVYNSNTGNLLLNADDQAYISVSGLTLSDKGFGGTNDQSFASLKLRSGDRLTIVGYRQGSQENSKMDYAYVESYYRFKPEDYEGVWKIYTYHLYGNEKEEIKKELTAWDAYLYVGANIFYIESMYPEKVDNKWQSKAGTCAIAVYDDETARVYVLGQYYDPDQYWWYYSNPDRHYSSIFTPVTVNGMGENWCSLGLPSIVEIGSYQACGSVNMNTRPYWEDNSYIYLSASSSSTSSDIQNAYVYKTYDINSETGALSTEEAEAQSPVYQFSFMTRESDLPSSTTSRRPFNKMIPRR